MYIQQSRVCMSSPGGCAAPHHILSLSLSNILGIIARAVGRSHLGLLIGGSQGRARGHCHGNSRGCIYKPLLLHHRTRRNCCLGFYVYIYCWLLRPLSLIVYNDYFSFLLVNACASHRLH